MGNACPIPKSDGFSVVIPLKGFGSAGPCSDSCYTGTVALADTADTLPPILDDLVAPQSWNNAVDQINDAARKIVGQGWYLFGALVGVAILVPSLALLAVFGVVEQKGSFPVVVFVQVVPILVMVLVIYLLRHHNDQRGDREMRAAVERVAEQLPQLRITYHAITHGMGRHRRFYKWLAFTRGMPAEDQVELGLLQDEQQRLAGRNAVGGTMARDGQSIHAAWS